MHLLHVFKYSVPFSWLLPPLSLVSAERLLLSPHWGPLLVHLLRFRCFVCLSEISSECPNTEIYDYEKVQIFPLAFRPCYVSSSVHLLSVNNSACLSWHQIAGLQSQLEILSPSRQSGLTLLQTNPLSTNPCTRCYIVKFQYWEHLSFLL